MLLRWENRFERFSDNVIKNANKIDDRQKERAKRRTERRARSGRHAV
jgi:hypothetical protein